MSDLRKQLQQLQMELSVYQRKWRDFHEMTKQHDERIQHIAFSASPRIKAPFYKIPSVECVLAKARGVVIDSKMLREDPGYLLDGLEERFWGL